MIGAAVVLTATALRARRQTVGPTEERIFRLFNAAPDAIHGPVWVVMQYGSLASVFVASGVLHRRGRTRDAVVTLATGVAVWAGVKLVKPTIGRGRPEAHLDGVRVRGHDQTGLGFPSGHTAVALTVALVSTLDASPFERAAALAAAATTAGARMYVGAHLPLDIAGGAAVGILASELAAAVPTRK